MKAFLYTTSAIGVIVAGWAMYSAFNATNEVFAAVVGLGALIAFVGGALVPKKTKLDHSFSSSVRYDPSSIAVPKSKRPPSAVRYDP
jgi:hypothetical protein